MKTYIEEYNEWIIENPNKVSKKIKALVKKLVKDIYEPQIIEETDEITGKTRKLKYIFDEKLAHRPIMFIENFCMHSKGRHRGKPFKLEIWQKAIIESIYGFVEEKTRLRKYNKAMIFIGRKNGKSTLASALALYHLMGDNEGGAEVYSVAVKRDQAKIVWDEAKHMIKFSPALRSRTKTTISEIRFDAENAKFKALASDSNTLDGLNAYFVSADEIHAWKDPNLLNVMYDSMASRDQPLMLMTTTMGFIRESVFDNEYRFASRVIEGYEDKEKGAVQENMIAWIYELDDVKDIDTKEMWYKANPGLGTIKSFKFLEDKVNTTAQNKVERPNILTKDFNVTQTQYTRWLTFEEAQNTGTFKLSELKGAYAVVGVDLSSTTDLTCATILIPAKGYVFVKQMYFIPKINLEKKIKEDKIPYDKWEQRGLIQLSEGAHVNYSDVTRWILNMKELYGLGILEVGYDPWGSNYWTTEMEAYGFKMKKVIQGAKTFSAPMKIMHADLIEKKIIYDNNPILHWCLTNTEVLADVNDNIRPIKGKNKTERIDGAVSLLNAYVTYQDNLENLQNLNGRRYGS